MTKKCSKCSTEKPLKSFHKSGTTLDGLRPECVQCFSKYTAEWRIRNLDRAKKMAKDYYSNNKEKIQKRTKVWRIKNKEKIQARTRAYYQENKTKILAETKKKRESGAIMVDRDHVNNYERSRYANNPSAQIAKRVRSRINLAVKRGDIRKTTKTKELLGCGFNKLRIHLQLMFRRNPRNTNEIMSWKNYGQWHIDHIKPVKAFDLKNENQLKQCFNYKNLQPLWDWENLRKQGKYNV